MFTRKEYATSVSGKTANGCPVRSAKPPDNMNFHYISPSAGGETLRGFNTQKGKAYRLPFLFCDRRIKQRKFLQDAQPVLVEGLPGCLKIGRKRFAVNLLPIRQRPVALAFPNCMRAGNLVEGYKRQLRVADDARRLYSPTFGSGSFSSSNASSALAVAVFVPASTNCASSSPTAPPPQNAHAL